jgi:hypothetical protein
VAPPLQPQQLHGAFVHAIASHPLRPSAQQRGPEAGGCGVGAQQVAGCSLIGEEEHMLVAVLRERCRHVDRHRQPVGVAHHQHHLASVEGASRHAPRHSHEERICPWVLRLRLRLRLHWRRRLPPPSAAPSPPSAALAQRPRRAAATTAVTTAATTTAATTTNIATTTSRVQRGRALGRGCRAAAEHLAVRPLPPPLRAHAASRARPYEQRAGRGVEGGPPQLSHLWRHPRRRRTRQHASRRSSRSAGAASGAKAARRRRRRHRGA